MPVKDRKSEGLSDPSRESKEGVRKTKKNLRFELQILPKVYHYSVASWTAPVKGRKSEGLSDPSRESKEGVRKTIKNLRFELQILPKIINGTYLLVLQKLLLGPGKIHISQKSH